jgi:hypothetical protein
MNVKAVSNSSSSSSTSFDRNPSAKSLHPQPKSPSIRHVGHVEAVSPSQKIAYLKEIEGKFQKPSSPTKKSVKEESLVFKPLTETEKQDQQAKLDRKHANARSHKVKFEAGNVDSNGRSEYSIIGNPRPESEFKSSIVNFAQAPSQSRDELIKKPKKSTPFTLNVPSRCPITEGDDAKPVSARSPGLKTNYITHSEGSRKTFLPSDRDDFSIKTARTTTAREFYHKPTLSELPKKLIKAKTVNAKNHGNDMKSLLEHHFAAIN